MNQTFFHVVIKLDCLTCSLLWTSTWSQFTCSTCCQGFTVLLVSQKNTVVWMHVLWTLEVIMCACTCNICLFQKISDLHLTIFEHEIFRSTRLELFLILGCSFTFSETVFGQTIRKMSRLSNSSNSFDVFLICTCNSPNYFKRHWTHFHVPLRVFSR